MRVETIEASTLTAQSTSKGYGPFQYGSLAGTISFDRSAVYIHPGTSLAGSLHTSVRRIWTVLERLSYAVTAVY